MKENNLYPHVFQPLKIKGVVLKNRLQYAPTVVLKCSPDGEVTPDMIEYVKWQAQTGVSYLTIGNTPIVHSDSSAWLCEMNVTSDKCIHGIQQLAVAARENGAEMSVELAHAGRGSATATGALALAPSDRPLDGKTFGRIKPMDRADMDYIVKQYCDCAVRCKKAGLKIVMLHCAHNNLLGQFLSPDSNVRTDEYGGSLANRMRFPLEVLASVRKAVGDDMVIEIRCSAQEDTPGGLELDESLEFMKAAQEYVDIIHVSRGNIFNYGGTFTIPTYFKGRQLNVAFAEKAKKVLKVPVAVVGNITSLAEAEDIIASGKADIVVMAKAYMADERLIQKSLDGKVESIRPCTRCDWCGKNNTYGTSMRCAINPKLGYTYDIAGTAKKAKNVMIIGGGPGGMMAAQTLQSMGHNATIYEKSDRLGGLLNDATIAPFKEYLRLYLQWDIRETESCGAKIVYNTEVTADMVKKENPDAVIVATGSTYLRPNISGINGEKVKTVKDVEHHSVDVGENVVVCGGGIVGLECALMLGMEGKKVRVIDMIPTDKMGAEMPDFNYMDMMAKLKENNVILEGDRRISAFTDEYIETVDSDGNVHKFEADTYVLALGVKPDNKLALELLGMFPEDVYVVGDCVSSGRVLADANQEGFHAAMMINR